MPRSTGSSCSGAGGAGAAVAHAVQRLGAQELTIVDVDPERADALADKLDASTGDLEAIERADGLIHATPTGMAQHPGHAAARRAAPARAVGGRGRLPAARDRIAGATLVQLGCRTLDGGGMAVMQAAGAFELFTGVDARP